jgi:GNAT superfamily N-acetyltransferase
VAIDRRIENGAPDSAVATRVARKGDLDGIREVQRHSARSFSEKFSTAISDAIDDRTRQVVVAEVHGEIVGWAATKYWADDDGDAPSGHYRMGITVAPENRQLGIGKALIEVRIEWIHHQADQVMFFANSTNTASLAAHRHWPFQEISRGTEFRGIRFDNGVGLLFCAQLD